MTTTTTMLATFDEKDTITTIKRDTLAGILELLLLGNDIILCGEEVIELFGLIEKVEDIINLDLPDYYVLNKNQFYHIGTNGTERGGINRIYVKRVDR